MSISVTNLRLVRGERTFVDALSFAVDSGRIHAIVGGNGTGKSTLISALAGDFAPTRGEILLDGAPLAALDDLEQAKRRAVLMQNAIALPFTPRDLIELAAPAESPAFHHQLLRDFDLLEFADRPLTTLSGGERGRAHLARVVAQGSHTLLLDEPTAAFDRSYRHRFAQWLEAWRRQGRAIVIVTHDAEIEALADSVTSLD